jgi:hypothetical protein
MFVDGELTGLLGDLGGSDHARLLNNVVHIGQRMKPASEEFVNKMLRSCFHRYVTWIALTDQS